MSRPWIVKTVLDANDGDGHGHTFPIVAHALLSDAVTPIFPENATLPASVFWVRDAKFAFLLLKLRVSPVLFFLSR
jgi:hypothetical protein